jgi:hypothetical protein
VVRELAVPVYDKQRRLLGYTPRVGVAFSLNGGEPIRRLAIFDSGADDTTIPAEVARDLGHPFEDLPFVHKATGVGSSFDCHCLQGLTIGYHDWAVVGDVLVAEPGVLDVTLLGRADFFSHFSVQFCWYAKPPEYYVLPADGAAPPPVTGEYPGNIDPPGPTATPSVPPIIVAGPTG